MKYAVYYKNRRMSEPTYNLLKAERDMQRLSKTFIGLQVQRVKGKSA